jgi:multiple sugar transport system substrate-binding protein
MKKLLIVVLGLLLMIAVSGLVVSGESKETQIEIWSFSVIPEALKVIQDEIIPAFEKANPGIKIRWQHVPYNGFREKLLTATAAGSPPDIAMDGSNMIGLMVKKRMATDLDKYFKKWDGRKDLLDSPLKDAMYNGKVYGMPVRFKPSPFLYRADLFQQAGLDPNKAPGNWKELIAYGKKLTKIQDKVMIQQGIGSLSGAKNSLIRNFELFLQQNGASFLTKDGSKPDFNNERGLEALQFLVEAYSLSTPIGVAPVPNTQNSAFAMGKVAMVPTNGFGELYNCIINNSTDGLKYSRLALPIRGNHLKGRRAAQNDGDMLILSPACKNPDAAWKFMEFFMRRDIHLKYSIANQTLPMLKSLIESDYVAKTPFYKDLIKMADPYGWVLTKTPEYPEARTEVGGEIEKAVAGKITPAEALKKSEQIWINAIKELR